MLRKACLALYLVQTLLRSKLHFFRIGTMQFTSALSITHNYQFMGNYILNEIKVIDVRNLPWMNKETENLIQ